VQDGPAAAKSIEADNPLAKFKAFNMNNYYIPALAEAADHNTNAFWFRYAQPIGRCLFRTSLPVSRVPTGTGATTSGVGDLNVFAAYLFNTRNPKVSLGRSHRERRRNRKRRMARWGRCDRLRRPVF
jgi:hypothetical protein